MVVFNGLGQQQHYFDSRLTYHASRSAMGVGMGAAGYPLTNTWAHQYQTAGYPASAYLGYNSAAAAPGLAYSSSLAGYTSSVIDPGSLLPATTGTAGTLPSDTTSPTGMSTIIIFGFEYFVITSFHIFFFGDMVYFYKFSKYFPRAFKIFLRVFEYFPKFAHWWPGW